MQPEVRYLILCDDVQSDPKNFHRIDVFGLLTRIRSSANPPFPHVRPLVCVLAIMTGCQGTGELSIRIVQSETGKVIFRNEPRRVRFAGDPEEVVGFCFRIQNCAFPVAGLYWLEFIFSGTVIARQRFSVTE